MQRLYKAYLAKKMKKALFLDKEQAAQDPYLDKVDKVMEVAAPLAKVVVCLETLIRNEKVDK